MLASRVLLALAALGGAAAVCPNACSGHGTCSEDDVCVCYQDWGMGDENSGDCSQKFCPYEFAFVDTPDEDGKVHKYMECSGKGICDRSVGECECFEGYGGKGCQRTTCPNDCSGHGTCEYIDELTFGSTPGEYHAAKPANFSMGLSKGAMTFASISESWDSMKSMACVCDAGYIDVDCSRRMCPKGNDIFDTRLDTSDGLKYQVQNITLVAAGPFGNGTGAKYGEFANRSFALTFVSTLNESYTTIPIVIGDELMSPAQGDFSSLASYNAFEATIKAALENLPNGVIDTVSVGVNFGSAYSDYDDNWAQWLLNIKVTFTGAVVAGPQNFLIPEVDECLAGCTPKITGLNLVSVQDTFASGDVTYGTAGTYSRVEEMERADYNNYECGRRGKCDYDSGMCECFEGYTGLACGTQTALV
jgi:hypothetical protein